MCIFPPLVIFALHRLSVRPNYIHPCVIASNRNRLPDRPLSCATCYHVFRRLSIPNFDFSKLFHFVYASSTPKTQSYSYLCTYIYSYSYSYSRSYSKQSFLDIVHNNQHAFRLIVTQNFPFLYSPCLMQNRKNSKKRLLPQKTLFLLFLFFRLFLVLPTH